MAVAPIIQPTAANGPPAVTDSANSAHVALEPAPNARVATVEVAHVEPVPPHTPHTSTVLGGRQHRKPASSWDPAGQHAPDASTTTPSPSQLTPRQTEAAKDMSKYVDREWDQG